MRVYIVGAGAVGTYLGGLLGEIGNEVIYAPRALEAVVPVECELALVTVKSYDTRSAIDTLRRALSDPAKTAIVTPQNGVGNEEQLADAFGADNVLAAALTVPVDRDASGKGVAAKGGGIAFAPVRKTSAHNWILAAFGATGLPTSAVEDYRALKWSKLALNVVANASCAILDLTPEQLVREDAVFAWEIRAMREVKATMRAIGVATIDLPRYPVRALQRVCALPTPVSRAILGPKIAGARGEKPPSLLLDLRGGKHRTEVDALNGAVVRAAAEAGGSAPINAVLTRLVNDIAHMPQTWPKYRERPGALVAAIQTEVNRRREVPSPS